MAQLLDQHARELMHTPAHAARHSALNQSACSSTPGANRSLACRVSHDETHALVVDADPDPLGNESASLPCPGFQAAMGSRTVRSSA